MNETNELNIRAQENVTIDINIAFHLVGYKVFPLQQTLMRLFQQRQLHTSE
jgi:hypothetical protein